MYAIDLHVHTSRYSQCAETLAPEKLGQAARMAGLAGIVLTEHDVVWGADEVRELERATPDIRFYRGVEITCRGAHVVAIAIPDGFALQKGLALREALLAVRAAGGVSILAHPYRDADPDENDAVLADAIEIASTSIPRSDTPRCRGLARRTGKPCVASSDAHAISCVGWAATGFSRVPNDERELGAWILCGRGMPQIADESTAERKTG